MAHDNPDGHRDDQQHPDPDRVSDPPMGPTASTEARVVLAATNQLQQATALYESLKARPLPSEEGDDGARQLTAWCATRHEVRGTNPMPSSDEAAEGWPERLLPVIWVVDSQGEVRSELDPLYRFLRSYVLLRQEVLYYLNR